MANYILDLDNVVLLAILISKRKIDSNGCWIYQGKITDSGYGVFRDKRVHRLMLQFKLDRKLDKDEFACHKTKDNICKSRACFNPEHLYAGDYQSNSDDYGSKDGWGGALVWRAKTHCNYGHLLDKTRSNGKRYCSTCNRDRNYKGERPRRGPYNKSKSDFRRVMGDD